MLVEVVMIPVLRIGSPPFRGLSPTRDARLTERVPLAYVPVLTRNSCEVKVQVIIDCFLSTNHLHGNTYAAYQNVQLYCLPYINNCT